MLSTWLMLELFHQNQLKVLVSASKKHQLIFLICHLEKDEYKYH